MAFGKKSLAIAMLGSPDNIRELTPHLAAKGIQLNKKDYVACEELINTLKVNKDIEYVFLSDEGMMGVPGGKFEIIPQIHSIKRDIYTVIFFNREKYSESYLKFAAKFGVKSVYYFDDPEYTTEKGSFDFNKILHEIKEKKRIYTPEIEDNGLEEEDLTIGDEKIKVVKVPVEVEVERIVEVEVEKKEIIEIEKEVEKIVEIEKPVEKIVEVVSPELSMQYIKDALKEVMQDITITAPGIDQTEIQNALNQAANQMMKPAESGVKAEDIRSIVSEVIRETMPKESHQVGSLEITPEIQQYIADSVREAMRENPQTTSNQNTRLGRRVSDYSQSASITIGVMNLASGSGASTTAVMLAEKLVNMNHTVAVVAYDGKLDLNFAPKGKVSYFVPEKGENKWDILMDVRRRRYQFIIIDFGNIIKVAPNGEEIYKDEKDFKELDRCHYKICMNFTNEWNMGKLGYFVANDDYPNNHSYLIALDEMKNPKALDRFGIQICERDPDLLLNIMLRKIGLY